MRYMLFAGDNYYPSGGMEDFVGLYGTLNELVANIGRADWFNVYDTVQRTIVVCPDIRWMNAQQIRDWADEEDRLASVDNMCR